MSPMSQSWTLFNFLFFRPSFRSLFASGASSLGSMDLLNESLGPDGQAAVEALAQTVEERETALAADQADIQAQRREGRKSPKDDQ
jgi:hypothetical protein